MLAVLWTNEFYLYFCRQINFCIDKWQLIVVKINFWARGQMSLKCDICWSTVHDGSFGPFTACFLLCLCTFCNAYLHFLELNECIFRTVRHMILLVLLWIKMVFCSFGGQRMCDIDIFCNACWHFSEFKLWLHLALLCVQNINIIWHLTT